MNTYYYCTFTLETNIGYVFEASKDKKTPDYCIFELDFNGDDCECFKEDFTDDYVIYFYNLLSDYKNDFINELSKEDIKNYLL